MTYAVIGTGAIGGYYGAKLANAGHDVHFLLHSDYTYVALFGLHVNSPDGDIHLPQVRAYNDVSLMPKADVVIVALKTTRQHLLPRLLPPLLHSRTLVLLIQNGIGLEPDLQQQFPGLWLAAGLAFICSAKTEPGIIRHQCYGHISIANYSCADQSVIDRLISDFTEAGVQTFNVPYLEARWKKAVWNMPFNGMTVALQTQTNLLLQNPHTRQLITEQMREVVGAAHALGVTALGEDFIQQMLEMTDQMVPYSPSMRLDYDFRRPMEIHYLYTRPIAIAREAGFEMPRLQMLQQQLLFIEQQYLG